MFFQISHARFRVCSLPIAVELQVTGHLSVRHGVWSFLQPQSLEVDANAAVGDDEVGVQRTLHPSSVLTEKREKLLEKLDVRRKYLHL